MKGKIFLVKNRNTANIVRRCANEKVELTGQSQTVAAGEIVLCVREVNAYKKMLILHGEQICEVNEHEYSEASPSDKLKGRSFCFTGALVNNREFYRVLIELHQGTFASGVTRDITYLVMAYPKGTSSKATKAKLYGTPSISEAQLMEMMK